jgi:hypothetical protein
MSEYLSHNSIAPGTKLNIFPGQLQHQQIIKPHFGVNFSIINNITGLDNSTLLAGSWNAHSPLGLYANNSSTHSQERKKAKKANNLIIRRNRKRLENRIKLYKKKEVSGSLLNTLPMYNKKKNGQHTYSRVYHCCKTPVKKGTMIDYVKGETGHNYYTNLQHCAMYWVCPVCAHKIEQARVDEIYNALVDYRSKGYEIYFITGTLPHYTNERLEDNLKILIEGFDSVKQHRSVQGKLKDKLVYLRSLEITYGKNGFHPHIHGIFILPPTEASDYLKEFKEQWGSMLKRYGKYNSYVENRAFKVDPWNNKVEQLADYVCKTGIADEVARGQSKKRSSGYTPFQILGLITDGQEWELKADQVEVFKEYAGTIKGKRMIQTSRGFYEMAGIQEKTDEEIVQDDKKSQVLFSVTAKVWANVIHKNIVTEMITAYDYNGFPAIMNCLDRSGIQVKVNYSNIKECRVISMQFEDTG